MIITYPLLNPETLEEDIDGLRYKVIQIGDNNISEIWYNSKSVLAYDKVSQEVTARIVNHVDELQSDSTEPVIFELDGLQSDPIPPINGQASIVFNAEVTGTYIVKTIMPNYRNGKIEVIVE